MYRSKFRHDFKLNGHAGSSSRKLHDRKRLVPDHAVEHTLLLYCFLILYYLILYYYCFTKRPNKGILEYGIYNQNLSQTRAWCFHGENINMLRALHSHITMVFDTL
jgi:hypothetical protein